MKRNSKCFSSAPKPSGPKPVTTSPRSSAKLTKNCNPTTEREMGDAESERPSRKAEIAELKKKPRERKRYWRRLTKAKTEEVFHFRNEAARRAAKLSRDEAHELRNSDLLTRAVKIGQVDRELVQSI